MGFEGGHENDRRRDSELTQDSRQFDSVETRHADIERSARARLGAWLLGERQLEMFVPCA